MKSQTTFHVPPITQSSLRYGGFWIRLGAYIIDSLILWIVYYAFSFILFMLVGEGEAVTLRLERIDPSQVSNETIERPFLIVGALFSIIVPWLYYTLFESSKYQATLGKKLFSLRVVDAEGSRISFGRANARYWSKILSALILYIGFLMIGWTKYKQGLHDKIAETYVLKGRQ